MKKASRTLTDRVIASARKLEQFAPDCEKIDILDLAAHIVIEEASQAGDPLLSGPAPYDGDEGYEDDDDDEV